MSLTFYGSPDNWYDLTPLVLLALRNAPKQNLSNFSLAKSLFGDSVCLCREFLESRTSILVLNQAQILFEVFFIL